MMALYVLANFIVNKENSLDTSCVKKEINTILEKKIDAIIYKQAQKLSTMKTILIVGGNLITRLLRRRAENQRN